MRALKFSYDISSLLRICGALVILAAVGCQADSPSTSTGNPYVSFKVTGSSQAATFASFDIKNWILNLVLPRAAALPPPALVDGVGHTVTLNHFWTTIGEVEFKPTETADSGEVEGAEVEFPGPYTSDLLATPEALVQGPIATSGIRRVRVKYIRTETLPTGAPAGLFDQALFIDATVNGNQFTVSLQDEVTFEVAGPTMVSLGDTGALILQIQTADLFKSIDLSAVQNGDAIDGTNRVAAAGACPSIDASATDLYTCFKKAFESQANFGEDVDGDGELESSDETVR